jgi:hypothetical protein
VPDDFPNEHEASQRRMQRGEDGHHRGEHFGNGLGEAGGGAPYVSPPLFVGCLSVPDLLQARLQQIHSGDAQAAQKQSECGGRWHRVHQVVDERDGQANLSQHVEDPQLRLVRREQQEQSLRGEHQVQGQRIQRGEYPQRPEHGTEGGVEREVAMAHTPVEPSERALGDAERQEEPLDRLEADARGDVHEGG